MANDTIAQIRCVQKPLRRPITKRQVKPLSQTGVLKPRDANRSIEVRKEKEAAVEERRLAREYKRATGITLPPPPNRSNQASIEAARVAHENGDVFFLDSGPFR